MNTSGKVFLPIEQDYLTLDEGAVIIHRGRKYGVWANKLMKVTPPLYNSVAVTRVYDHDNSTHFVRVRNHNKWALLDGGGAEVTPFKYGSFQWFYRQLAIVEIDGKYGIINSRGKEIVPCVYSSIENGADNRGQFIVKKGIYFGIIDSAGKTVAPVVYDRIIVLHSFFAGKYRVMYQGKIGLMDGATKKIVIPCEYDDVKFPGNDSYGYDYGNNYTDSQYLIACKNGYWGLIDKKGKECLSFSYYKINLSNEYVFFVNTFDNKQGLFDIDLKQIVPPDYSMISLIHPGIYVVHSYTTLGLISTGGDMIAEPLYKSVDFCGDKIILKKGEKFGALDMKGKEIIPFIYSLIECDNGQLKLKQ